MKVINVSAPFMHRGGSVRSAMLTVILCLLTVLAFASFLYGAHILLTALISVVMCVVTESLLSLVTRLPNTIGDCSAAVTGLILTALLPPTVPIYVLLAADAFAILLAKGVFGGLGHNPFNPAACAMAFVTVSWPARAFAYEQPFQAAAEAVSAGSYLRDGGLPPFRIVDALLGNLPSSAGTACFIVLAASFVTLCIKGIVRWRISLSFLLSSAVFAALFNRTGDVLLSVFWELFSGFLLFAAVFMFTDPSTSPKSGTGCVLYGFLGGLTVILMRNFGVYEEGLCFALILCNALAPTLDRMTARIALKKEVKDNHPQKRGNRHAG